MVLQADRTSEGFPSDLLLDLPSSSGRGLRERLEHSLRAAIQEGRLVPGTTLPPTRALAAQLAISRSVVVEAYRNLAADGYLEARQGSGTRVRSAPRPPGRRARRSLGPVVFLDRPRDVSPAGVPRIRLTGGLPDPALFPRARWLRHYRAALTELPDPGLTYPSIGGAGALRRALTAYLGRVRGVATTEDRVVVCNGFTQGLTLICRALRREGARRMAVEDPCFALHREGIARAGLEPVPVPVDDDGLDVDALARTDVSAVLVAPAHSYPTGGTLTPPRRAALIAWARENDAVVIEDDYDAEFRYDRLPVGALQGLAPDNVVHVGGISKTLSPAMRLGWACLPPCLVESVEREKRYDDLGSPLLEQLAFARFLEHGDFARHLRRVRPVYRARRDATIAALTELLPQVRWQGAAAGLHLFVCLPDGTDLRKLGEAAHARGLTIEDAAWHYAEPSAAPPAIVLGYGGLPEPMLRRGVAILADALAGA
jgi:GntR family transcriptional regulator / MocR family aminotransferase